MQTLATDVESDDFSMYIGNVPDYLVNYFTAGSAASMDTSMKMQFTDDTTVALPGSSMELFSSSGRQASNEVEKIGNHLFSQSASSISNDLKEQISKSQTTEKLLEAKSRNGNIKVESGFLPDSNAISYSLLPNSSSENCFSKPLVTYPSGDSSSDTPINCSKTPLSADSFRSLANSNGFSQFYSPLELVEPINPPKTHHQPHEPKPQAFLRPDVSTPITNPSKKLFNDIQQYVIQQTIKLATMIKNQKNLIRKPNSETFNVLTNEQKLFKDQLESEYNTILRVFDQVILDPSDLQMFFHLKSSLRVQLKQLELLILELNHLVQTASTSLPLLAALVIVKQPFPLAITKGKQISEDQLVVQLLTASNISLQSISPMKAILLSEFSQGKGSSSGKMLEGELQPLNLTSKTAKFPLKFLTGTKKAMTNIHFSMYLSCMKSSGPHTVESPLSEPFIVITNECQWEGAAGRLLKKDIFSDRQMEVTWQRFANALQYHFIRATRQENTKPGRYLSQYDLNFLHKRFFGGNPNVSLKEFDPFWDWFGKAMQKLRYQRHIGTMWQSGLLYGFMGREDVNAALFNQEPGTFIIRFSERFAGQFAIAYIGNEAPNKIKHYLVQPNDTAAAKKTLPDFLDECRQFTKLLVLSYDAFERPTFLKTPKNEALEPFCGKKPTSMEDDPSGYDPLET